MIAKEMSFKDIQVAEYQYNIKVTNNPVPATLQRLKRLIPTV